MSTNADTAILVQGALAGYPSDPKYKNPFEVWVTKAVEQRTLPEDAMTCADVGVKREVAIGFAQKGAAATSTALVAAEAITATTAALTFGIGGLIAGVLTAIFSKHKQKVAEERQILCTTVPAVNEALAQTDAKVRSGEWSAAQGIAAVEAIKQEYYRAVTPILKDNAKQCNAACGYGRALGANVEARKLDYPQWEPKTALTYGAIAAAVIGAVVLFSKGAS